MSAEEARYAALRSFGNPTLLREQARAAWSWNWLELLLRDMRYGLRTLARTPGFAAIAILVMALGIGANVALFTIVRSVLLKPLTFPDADRIVEFLLPSSIANNLASIPEFHAYQRQTSVFQEVAAYDRISPGFNLTGERPELIQGIHVTEGYFRLFGAPVILGRTFTPQEDAPNGGKVVVLSYTCGSGGLEAILPLLGSRFPWARSPTPLWAWLGRSLFQILQRSFGCHFSFRQSATI